MVKYCFSESASECGHDKSIIMLWTSHVFMQYVEGMHIEIHIAINNGIGIVHIMRIYLLSQLFDISLLDH